MRLVIEDGKIELGGNVLIEHISFDVNENSKIAIIGKNGCGKTSLLKVIEGELDLTFDSSNLDGYINKSNDFSIGYLKQISFSDETRTLEEEMLDCYKDILEKKKQLDELEQKLIVDSNEKIIMEYSRAHEIFENMGGYYYQKEYNMVLKKFGFDNSCLAKSIGEFSGGERTKISFIKLLLSKPDLLLLDEPTNHLDIEAIEWLEEYLKNYKKAFIVVSHDREFINKVTKVIYEVEYNTLNKYVGNYNDYLKEKEIRYKSQEKRYFEQQKELSQKRELIERFRYKATKAKMVQSKIKQLDKLEIVEPPKKSNTKTFKFDINPSSESGKEVLNVMDLEIGYNKVLSKINLQIAKGQKVAVIGENGTAKSTFLKTIIGEIKPISGEYKYGFNVRKGYFDQQSAIKVSDKTIIDDYRDSYPYLDNQQARSDLGAFLFSGADVDKKISVLSGGEVVRLALCKILKAKPNFLILDEPTNHMDIYSKECIEKMLKEYKGTILFVSHDRYFVRKIATSLLVLEHNKATYYPYGYEQYISKKENKTLDIEVVSETKNSKEIEKDNINNRSNLKKEFNKLEREIKEYEAKIESINLEFEKEEIYTDFILSRKLEEELEFLEDQLESALHNWEKIGILLEEK